MMLFALVFIGLSSFISLCVFIYSVNQIRKRGFNCCSTFLMILILFYTIIPILFLVYDENRDLNTAFNRLLSTKSIEDIAITMFFASVLIMLFLVFYNIQKKNNSLLLNFNIFNCAKRKCDNWKDVQLLSRYKIERVADISLILGGISIVLCIMAVGGVGNYLALGSQTRGLNKNLSDYISSSFLPLITLSNIILAAPFLYKYIIGIDKKRSFPKVKFWISFTIAILYLLYNQGRLPLLLFFVPFLLDLNITKKAKIGTLTLVTILCIFVLEPLSNLFTYLSYGRIVINQPRSFLDTILLEFTYPFANFINRNELMDCFGMRFGIDYIQWPLTIFPSSILKIFGFSKSGIVTIGTLNTNAYSMITGEVGGGIPTDFFTFNYYQFGIVSLLLAIMIVARIIYRIDLKSFNILDDEATRILSLRICFLLISMVNNFDFSVIFRMRFDFIIIVWAIFYISKIKERYSYET